jgi:hypothetical protein
MAAPDATTCAACGASGELHEHHLVPRAYDGTALPTVMLCLPCHGIVHQRAFSVNHSELTRRGLAAAKARGVKLGNPQLKAGNRASAIAAGRAHARRARSKARDVLPFLDAARKAGCTTLGQIAAALEARGVKTPSGRPNWSAEQVRRISLHAKAAGL